MKVLHVTNIYPSSTDPTAGLFIKTQIESLTRAGVSVDVCEFRGSGIRKYLHGWKAVRQRLRQRNYDIVHAHYMYTGWVARLATTLPVVVSLMGSDLYGKTTSTGRHRPFSRVLHLAFANALALVVDHTIVKSSGMAEALLWGRRSIVPNGVDRSIFRPISGARGETELRADGRYVLFAGNPSNSVKRFRLAEQAMAMVKLTVPAAELIWITGRPAEDVAVHLNAADCLVITSSHEGSSNILKEALACGLPVVSVAVGDAAERLKGIDNCFVTRAEPPAIAEAVVAVLRSGRRSMNARQETADLGLEQVAKRIVDIYASLQSSNRGQDG